MCLQPAIAPAAPGRPQSVFAPLVLAAGCLYRVKGRLCSQNFKLVMCMLGLSRQRDNMQSMPCIETNDSLK